MEEVEAEVQEASIKSERFSRRYPRSPTRTSTRRKRKTKM